MPFLYTHYRFGQKCLESLPSEYKNIVYKNINYYNIGTQGPNIFYYHSPFTSKKFKNIADNIHKNNIHNTIIQIKDLFNKNKERDAILSYTFGYISHFILDSYCDDYLKASSYKLNTSINILNKEIDNYYLQKDNIYNVNKILDSFKSNDKIYICISNILNTKEKDIKQSIANFSTYSKILFIRNKNILAIFNKILLLIKKRCYIDLFIHNTFKIHTPQIIRIEKYFQIALLHYQILIKNVIDFIYNDIPLDEYFNNPFKDKNNVIKVLNIEEEKEYMINDFMK